MRVLWLIAAFCLASALPALPAHTAPAAARAPLIYSAASAAGALDEILAGYRPTTDAAQAGQGRYVAGSSGLLARQIENGAPAGIFISANRGWMDYLAKRGRLAADSRQVLVANRLVLIAPKDTVWTLTIAPGFALAAALGSSRLAIGDPSHTPLGQYGRRALIHLGVWDGVRTKIAPAGSARAALALVERGESAAGIVYATDAQASTHVRVVDTFPADSHGPITYEAALIAGRDGQATRALFAHLFSAAARDIFIRHGFSVPG